MTGQIIFGFLLIMISLVVHSVFLVTAIHTVQRLKHWLSRPPHFRKLTLTFSLLSIWLLISMGITSMIWATYFQWKGAFASFEESLYFSLVSITTLGFGDVILAHEHRLLAGLLAANGLILFGLTTAILIEIIHKLYQTQVNRL